MPGLKKIKLDEYGAVEFEADTEVIKTLEAFKLDSQTKTNELKIAHDSNATLQAKFDALQAQFDSFKSEKEKEMSKEVLQQKVDEAVKEKLQLLQAATLAKVDSAGRTDAEIKKEIITKAFPKVDLTNRNDVYIQAMFDAAIGNFKNEQEDDKQNKMDMAPLNTNNGAQELKTDSEQFKEIQKQYYNHIDNALYTSDKER